MIFRGIFENNTSSNRQLFFSNNLIRHIWNEVIEKMPERMCFKKSPKEDIFDTYKYITFLMNIEDIKLPSFWRKKFPPQPK